MRKTASLIVLSFAAFLFLVKCGGDEKKSADSKGATPTDSVAKETPKPSIVGKWTVTNFQTTDSDMKDDPDGMAEILKDAWWQFDEDGKVSSTIAGEPFISGTWTLSDDGKKLTINSEDEEGPGVDELTVNTLDEKTLKMTLPDEDGGDMVWECTRN